MLVVFVADALGLSIIGFGAVVDFRFDCATWKRTHYTVCDDIMTPTEQQQVTDLRNLPCCVLHAECLPLIWDCCVHAHVRESPGAAGGGDDALTSQPAGTNEAHMYTHNHMAQHNRHHQKTTFTTTN